MCYFKKRLDKMCRNMLTINFLKIKEFVYANIYNTENDSGKSFDWQPFLPDLVKIVQKVL